MIFKFANGSLIVTIQQGDLSKEACDAIVNSTNLSMTHNGGLDTIIHKTMGQYFTDQVVAIINKKKEHACPVGQSRIFIAKFNRDENMARFVINTVGPVYKKEEQEQAAFQLQSCYYTSLALANLYGLSSIAYPAISCGVNKFPPNEAAKVGIESVRQYSYHVKDVRFILFDRQTYDIFVQEWTDYSQKVNREANITDERDRPCTPPPPTPPPSSARYCVLCKEKQLTIDRQLLCNDCSNKRRSEIFIKFLQRLRYAAEKSYDDLRRECDLLKPILSSYPLVYKPAQKFDLSIHTRDEIAEHYLQTQCDKEFRRATMPMAIVGDGNCFYNTFVKLGGVGTTTEASSITPIELRARNVVELVLNINEYEKKYQSLKVILDDFEDYVKNEMVHDTNYAAIWDFLSIPTVLNINVISVYPKVNGDSDLNYQNLNGRVYTPLINEDIMNNNELKVTTTPSKDVKILFSHCNKPVQFGAKKENWTPNHFVPILNL